MNIPTITDNTNGRLKKIMEFAQENKISEQFMQVLSRFLLHLSNGFSVELYSDSAPYSLYFVVKRNGELSFNGGVIYHGPHDNGGSGQSPTFSVSMDNDTKPHWSIHT